MRRVIRPALPKAVQTYLNKRQSSTNTKRGAGQLDIEKDWKTARRTKKLESVLITLQQMMGPRERCMYCVDSHGSDIEHFRPKGRYPRRAFQWSNMLLCCTECGRIKGTQFPVSGRRPLLIDPSIEDPWQHLDFDPVTGNLTARFDVQANDWSPKGSKTVEVLRLNRREAVAAGCVKTLTRLAAIVQTSLVGGVIAPQVLIDELKQADDHGLLGWCFSSTGRILPPFSDLYQHHPAVWSQCTRAL